MPIRPPALDDRRYEDLVSELLARIPAHAPEWTNPTVGDPGRTLIELFAWLGDALLYRANLIPERQRLAFLRLLGQPLRPARPARGLVTLDLAENEAPAKLSLQPPEFDGPARFEALEEITVLPLQVRAFYKRGISTDALAPGLEEALGTLHGQGAEKGGIKPYVTTPLFAGGQPAAEAFDAFGAPSDRCVWLGLFASKGKDPAGKDQAEINEKTLDALRSGDGRVLLNLGVVPGLAREKAFPINEGDARQAVPHDWEITINPDPQPIDENHSWQPEYLALEEVSDTTNGFTRPGVVRLALPNPALLHAPTNDVRLDPNAGVGDRPPRLDDEGLGRRLIAWIRLRAKPTEASPPFETKFTTSAAKASQASRFVSPRVREVEHLWLAWMGANAVEVEQLVTRTRTTVGESDGSPDQEFQLPATSIQPESLELQVEEEGGLVRWRAVDDLVALDRDAAISRDARVFQLDAEAGVVRFGDGLRGRIPAAGRRIIVNRLRAGGGATGNLPADSLRKVTARTIEGQVVRTKLVVSQPLPFSGGSDAETLAEAERRIPALFRHRDRAVTADDYRTLAREAPGLAVGRAEVLPLFKPHQQVPNVPGVVTVLALPHAPLGPAPNPRADRPFLEGLHAWLGARRPLGTEFYTCGCEYVPVAVSVAVSLREDAQPTMTIQAIKEALRRVLWPLPADPDMGQPGGGFDGQGWPLRRPLSNRELAVEVARVAGVSEVAGLNLFRFDATAAAWKAVGDARDGREQNVPLERWQLPELMNVVVVTAETPPLSLEATTRNPFADAQSVAVPVVPQIC